ncbi:50S ribosomal protein L4 [Robiginitomaculum antarcticum]|uniref:50S ribosomal protein L4 n=1 Tax=Robiginitomaculum antarcticum TaxID=437507 RepID=UPI0003814F38|nr:50S ribosomal protein L4 [Robiginitomaculum antarcticum]
MKCDITKLDGKTSGSVDLDDAIFGLEPRKDILHRMVRYQLAKRQQGTHQVQERGDVSKTTKRIGKQKGGGTARHGNGSVSQFRGGGKAHGPRVRDHSFDLPKKVRALAMKHALSAKAGAGELIIVDDVTLKAAKTSDLVKVLEKMGVSNGLIVGGRELDSNLSKAAQNVKNLDVLPSQGANVYDILRRHTLVLSKEAVADLEARLK